MDNMEEMLRLQAVTENKLIDLTVSLENLAESMRKLREKMENRLLEGDECIR